MNAWGNICRSLNLIVSFVLFYTTYFQTDRENGFMWTMVFLMPALLTFIVSARPQIMEIVELHAVWSVSFGFLLCLLVYLVGVALRAAARGPPFLEADSSILPVLPIHRESWDVISVSLMLMWLKFLSKATKENLREAGTTTPQVSALRMLKMTLLFTVFMGCMVTVYFASYSYSPTF
ncbi:uncharacterized protein LOC123505345 [Portunus trituberculatus]|uniref:uncharacterized protein LOC123505345 n=1 Tax=Portunus trituberculatus TaxID=210409 RepID=UPI001E1CD50D|nr:uncharacterized protein LOC123505345 [Portunus trituberculatus]